jgi:hypothetical protein
MGPRHRDHHLARAGFNNAELRVADFWIDAIIA